jgi:hypothetical protein
MFQAMSKVEMLDVPEEKIKIALSEDKLEEVRLEEHS